MPQHKPTDAGARYRCTLPFSREVSAEDRAEIHEALASAEISTPGQYGNGRIDTPEIEVTADTARVTVALSYVDDHSPTDVLATLARALGEWNSQTGGPVIDTIHAGGERSVETLDAAALDLDRDPPNSGGHHTYLLAFPDRPLTDDEVTLLAHVTDETAVVAPSFVALVDGPTLVYHSPAERTLHSLRETLNGHVPPGHALRTRGFFGSREVGTLALVDEEAREALHRRGRHQTPHTAADTDAADRGPV